ncbi:hypothetical protein F442_02126 [Phytophthora nicotianae P10297]|uniref:Uncharacterized protein n=1 Tax=Phytophthora nicotianae P10297 TaxID=1317064 RepID=W3A100_PHYNI|nr:hypothetical protein F442_02126 [Phytophthora nicotianae P10297]
MSDPPTIERRTGGTGGSSQTVPRKKQKPRNRLTAFERACALLGTEKVEQLQATYKSLESKWGGTEHPQTEGMVLSLIGQGVPDAQVRAIFGVGGSKIARLKATVTNGNLKKDIHVRIVIYGSA